jgi:DNA-damage-inducible protein D
VKELNSVKVYSDRIFESIKLITDEGVEFWYARDLQNILEYSEWRNFVKVIDRAKIACEKSQNDVPYHFVDVNNMVELGSGAQREVEDIMLSRYACYLIVQNGDPRKEIIALGQTYFALKTRQSELDEKTYGQLSEEQKLPPIYSEQHRQMIN